MNQKRNTRQLALIGSMLFGLFFGAGNLIFPMILGARAGTALPAALIGLLVTAVGIPLLGIVSIGVSRSEGLIDLSGRVSKPFCYLFTCALYLTIGPLFAIPRCAATSFTIGIRPLVGEQIVLPQLIFSGLFFAAVLYFALKPSKILDSVGKFLNPAFLVFLGVMLVTALVKPANPLAAVSPSGGYDSGAFFTGFLQGYDTLDALASLAFGIIVVHTIRQLGVKEPAAVAGSTVKAGIVSMSLMALIYTATALVGAQSYALYADELASNPAFNGGDAFAIIAHHYFGRGGSLILAATVTLCCMKTAIGLVTACSETFLELFPGRMDYPKWAVAFTAVSFLISNIGLSQIIALSAPVLYFLCPLSIVLILLGIAGNWFGHARIVYQCTIILSLFAAILELARVVGGPCKPIADWTSRWLPLYTYGLGWVIPAVAGFVVGLLLKRKGVKA
ncbi:MAG: branched-chain amino acid transport system II carrier protein [Oscillibacter sp.]|nr:branched-chain amino acid transport system II carrier protein [Oscillibacter sp.]